MTADRRIVLSKQDVMRLRALFGRQRALSASDLENLLDLQEEIERAVVVEDDQLPSDIVVLDSRVLVRDVETGICNGYTLVLPSQANLADGRLSVLAPLGTALLGYRRGDEVEWWMPGGLRRLKIEAVMQAERSPDGPSFDPRERLAA